MEQLEQDNIETVNDLSNFGQVIEHFDAVPDMSSLPIKVKENMAKLRISPHYENQMSIVKHDGTIDSWVASSSDTFAQDWILS